MTNHEVMKHLLAHARTLDRQGGALFQARAFRSAAIIVDGLPRPVEEILSEEGRAALEAVPGIGQSIAYAIEHLLTSGEVRVLRPQHLPAREQLRSLEGIGRRTAERLQDEEGIGSVSEGRSTGRLAGLRRRAESRRQPEPSIEVLLGIDAEFRGLCAAGVLGRVAPRAYQPEGGEWVPMLTGQRHGWAFRATWANTALVHRLGKTRDWVEVRFQREGTSGSRTVVTEPKGERKGQRVVRGREDEGAEAA